MPVPSADLAFYLHITSMLICCFKNYCIDVLLNSYVIHNLIWGYIIRLGVNFSKHFPFLLFNEVLYSIYKCNF